MNKKILRVNYDFDFTLIGIITPLRPYRLCWFLNNQLKMSLEREEDLSLRHEPEEEAFFPRYFFYIEESETDFFVLGNRGTEGYLVPEQKEIDFFMLIYNLPGKDGGLPRKEDGMDLVKKIKGIPEVQSAFLLDPTRLKSRENLLF